jgi:hypothetical protein
MRNATTRRRQGAAVLSETERRRLAEIETWFETTDPRLVRRLAGTRLRLRQRRWVMVLFGLFAVALAVVTGAELDDPPVGIVAGLTVVAVICGCWWTRRAAHRTIRPVTGTDRSPGGSDTAG